MAGALLAGGEDFIAQARRWRRRLGGTLVHLSPLAASAAMKIDERLALMPALVSRTQTLAAGLAPLASMRVNPALPPTNMFHLYFDAAPERVLDARDAVATRTGCWLFERARPAEVPGWSVAELSFGDRLLAADNATVLAAFAELDAALRAKAQ